MTTMKKLDWQSAGVPDADATRLDALIAESGDREVLIADLVELQLRYFAQLASTSAPCPAEAVEILGVVIRGFRLMETPARYRFVVAPFPASLQRSTDGARETTCVVHVHDLRSKGAWTPEVFAAVMDKLVEDQMGRFDVWEGCEHLWVQYTPVQFDPFRELGWRTRGVATQA